MHNVFIDYMCLLTTLLIYANNIEILFLPETSDGCRENSFYLIIFYLNSSIFYISISIYKYEHLFIYLYLRRYIYLVSENIHASVSSQFFQSVGQDIKV